MASLLPNATQDELEEELEFQEVLISSLDPGADDYVERLGELERNKQELESRLDALQSSSRPHTLQSHKDGSSMDAAQNRNGWWQATLNGVPGSYDSQYNIPYTASASSLPLNGGMKRPLPQSLRFESQHPSKRPTPEPSNAGTPTSSADSFEFIEHPSAELSERARMRQLQAEAALKRQRDGQLADEELARSLSQQQNQHRYHPSSSQRPGIQTTLSHNGSYQRPPPPPVELELPPMAPPATPVRPSYPDLSHSARQSPQFNTQPLPPYIKSESGSYMPQQLPQRLRRPPEVVDLTAADSDDEDDMAIAPRGYTPSSSVRRPGYPINRIAPPVIPQQLTRSTESPIPGFHPMAGLNAGYGVYGNANNTTGNDYSWMQQTNYPLLSSAVNGIRNVAGHLGNSVSELGNLINGGSSFRPLPIHDDDDDEVVFGGSRQLPPNQHLYAGRDDLYRQRYEDILNYDPAKTKEEINKLLDNIRPDEEMPAHLRVSTPEAMTIKLHKYQEIGLTWLQKCEQGSNKGGILADDMGLGKTIQMLSLIVTHKSEDPRCKTTLIVAPVALMRQWKQEIEQKIKPGRHRLTVYVQHGQSKKKNFRDLSFYDIVLTTFGSLAAELKKLEKFRLRQHHDREARPAENEKCALIGDDAQWYRVILDEAQCIKNKSTQTAKGACILNAKYRFCMTGTPMMNNVDELYSLVRFLRIKPYSEWERFRMDFTTPIKSGHDVTKDRAMRTLQVLCKAIMLRRTKKSTFEGKPILVLPERTTEVNNPEFSEDEMNFYKALENRTQLQFNKYLQRGAIGSSYTAILVLLLRLRQACCHPHLIKDFGVSATADVTPDDLITLAKELAPPVVARIKETNGNFECPVCYDAVTNPAIFIPCGHDTCSDCFARIADPANAIRDGNENATGAKCPNCRGPIEPKRITDFESFKKVHMPELLTTQELEELQQLQFGEEEDDDSETVSDDGSETESEDASDEVDAKGNLAKFVVNSDHEDSETESEAEEANIKDDIEEERVAGPSTTPAKSKVKSKTPKKSKNVKGKKREKKEKKKKQTVTLAELKKLANRNAKARRAYIRRLRADWITSAKIEKTMETLKGIMDDPEGEKVLIFSQWTSLLDLLEVPVDNEGWGYRRYDGSMNAKMRGDAVDDFRDHTKDVRIMLVSLKAGNAGLNLNMASQVIILDPFWNPYIEEQAIDRAHRIGQTRPVKVHRMLIQGTVEDRILELQEKKRALISEALDEKASQSIARLGVQELAYLFGVTRNPTERVNYRPRDR